jgi:pyruvate dehydrogenase (quinone)
MPPNVTLEQAAMFGQSLARGEANRAKIALTVLTHQVRAQLSAARHRSCQRHS